MKERGNAVILILVVIALFGALAISMMKSGNTGTGAYKNKTRDMAVIRDQSCAIALDRAEVRLNQRGCAGLISYAADGSNSISGAPTDGSCSIYNTNGGGVTPCSAPTVSACPANALIGTVCPGGLIYAGITPDGGAKMYTTANLGGTMAWSSFSGAISASNMNSGTLNTVNMEADSQPYPAAEYCFNLTAHGYGDWYLPAYNELAVMYTNRVAIGGFGNNELWSSTLDTGAYAKALKFQYGSPTSNFRGSLYAVRCTRHD